MKLSALFWLPIVWVLCGGLGTLAGVLASTWLHGTARTAVFAAVGIPVAIGAGWATEHLADRMARR